MAVAKKVVSSLARLRAKRAALRGEGKSSDEHSLDKVVELSLRDLAEAAVGPAPLSAYRSWLQDKSNLDDFVSLVIAHAGGRPEMTARSKRNLEESYVAQTRDTRAAPEGLTDKVVAYIVRPLQATESGRQLLNAALTRWTALAILSVQKPAGGTPSEDVFDRAHAAAKDIVSAAKRSWKMPRFVAPLQLHAIKGKGFGQRAVSQRDVLADIEASRPIVLTGPGGIGKTTFALEVAGLMLEQRRQVPLFVDAPAWARTGMGLFEFAASLPASNLMHVSAADLTRLALDGRVAVLLNGWNEMLAASKLACRDALIQATTTIPRLSFVVTTRTESDAPAFEAARQYEVQGLLWDGQSAIIRSELGEQQGGRIIGVLARNSRLRYAARSPLILRGLVAAAKTTDIDRSSVMDLLGSAVRAYQEDDQRNLVLKDAPVDGQQQAYLEDIAVSLNIQRATSFAREAALRSITATSNKLLSLGTIAAMPNSNAILEVLASHHLLYVHSDSVRFAHQRFQEYFSACRILSICASRSEEIQALSSEINEPSWADAISLVAEHFRGESGNPIVRRTLLRSAAAVDLTSTCALAGAMGFVVDDDVVLYNDIVERLRRMYESPWPEVRSLSLSYQRDTQFPDFADNLWEKLESDDEQSRLFVYRTEFADGLSALQLGKNPRMRVSRWPTDRRIEFVSGIARNPENFEILLEFAKLDPEPSVRVEAIQEMFWHFPASEEAIELWLHEDIRVQSDHSLVSWVSDLVQEGRASADVRGRLIQILKDTNPLGAIRTLAKIDPESLRLVPLAPVFSALETSALLQHDASELVSIAKLNGPSQLDELATKLAVSCRAAPYWVHEHLSESDPILRRHIFDKVWRDIGSRKRFEFDSRLIGSFAELDQVRQLMGRYLQLIRDRRASGSSVSDQEQLAEDLLLGSSGDLLLQVSLERAQRADYAEALILVQLLEGRIQCNDRNSHSFEHYIPWLPSVEAIRTLVSEFLTKEAPSGDFQLGIPIHLCAISSRVSPQEFEALILETCRRHLDAWSEFKIQREAWVRSRRGSSVSNPSLGLYLISALSRCGFQIMPKLLALAEHPEGRELVPDAVARIAGEPWKNANPGKSWGRGFPQDIQDGNQRQERGLVFSQPDAILQPWTDEAAMLFGQHLQFQVDEVNAAAATDGPDVTRRRGYSIGGLCNVVAALPSHLGIAPVRAALSSGSMDLHRVNGAVRSWLRQGYKLDDPSVVSAMESLYQKHCQAAWFDESTRHALATFCGILTMAVSPEFLAKPQIYYVSEWRRHAHLNDVIREVGACQSPAGWPVLMLIAASLPANSRVVSGDFAHALISSLAPQHFDHFCALICDGSLERWIARVPFKDARVPPSVVQALQDPKFLDQILTACRAAGTKFADSLALEMLRHVPGAQELRLGYLLEVLDAGRAADSNSAIYRLIKSSFKLEIQEGPSAYSVVPRSNNFLRSELFTRALRTHPAGDSCKCLLASIEGSRMHLGRPTDEPRHPGVLSGGPWTDIFMMH